LRLFWRNVVPQASRDIGYNQKKPAKPRTITMDRTEGRRLLGRSPPCTRLLEILGTGVYAGRDLRLMPQLILLDVKLPKVDGLEVLRRLRADERTRLLPVVLLTSSKEEQDLINGYRLGANSYVRKPVDFIQFAEAVRHLEVYWLVVSEAPPRGRAA
jgi:CheY-like chemotaxis protein